MKMSACDDYTCVCAVGYTMDTVYFGWIENPVEIDTDVQFPQFKHIDSLLYDCSMNYTAGACAVTCAAARLASFRSVCHSVIGPIGRLCLQQSIYIWAAIKYLILEHLVFNAIQRVGATSTFYCLRNNNIKARFRSSSGFIGSKNTKLEIVHSVESANLCQGWP